MKLAVMLFVLLALAVAVGWQWQSRGGDRSRQTSADVPTQIAPQTPTTQFGALGVDELMRNVQRYRGPVAVVGVVSGVSADEQLLALIDSREFAECGIGCAELTLPVQWAGPLPTVRKTIRVEGEVRESSGKLTFVASAIEELGQ